MYVKCIILQIVIIVALYSGCGKPDLHTIGEHEIKMKIPRDAQVLQLYDDHDSFFGEGEFFMMVQFDKKQMIEFVKAMPADIEWQKLPLSNLIKEASTRGFSNNEWSIPTDAKKGFYYFHDYEPEMCPDQKYQRPLSEKKYTSSYVIAILDVNVNKLFIFRHDE